MSVAIRKEEFLQLCHRMEVAESRVKELAAELAAAKAALVSHVDDLIANRDDLLLRAIAQSLQEASEWRRSQAPK